MKRLLCLLSLFTACVSAEVVRMEDDSPWKSATHVVYARIMGLMPVNEGSLTGDVLALEVMDVVKGKYKKNVIFTGTNIEGWIKSDSDLQAGKAGLFAMHGNESLKDGVYAPSLLRVLEDHNEDGNAYFMADMGVALGEVVAASFEPLVMSPQDVMRLKRSVTLNFKVKYDSKGEPSSISLEGVDAIPLISEDIQTAVFSVVPANIKWLKNKVLQVPVKLSLIDGDEHILKEKN